MGREKKKYLSGAAAQFITRKQACNKLQLTLADFRRLCILKGIYPHEPNNRKKVGRGSTAYKTYYYKKDIQFLLHEPIINKFRQHKIYLRKLARARGREEKEKYHHLKTVHPQFKVDHIVRERYPNFIDALRDIDDALCMCNLFASLPKIHQIKPQTTHLCRRLCVEFMHYVIGSRSLKKAFISIKGYYYQAEIMNQTTTWLVPHNFAHTNFSDVDYRIMTTFTQFYTTMLGFVLYRLYQSLNLHYPPKIALLSAVDSGIEKDEKEKDITPPQFCLQDNKMEAVVASLNVPLVKFQVEEEEEKDEEDQILEKEMTEDAIEAKKKRLVEEKFKNLFTGCKFFLSREVPKEQFVFVIKCFGGEVSWDKTDGLGSTFTVDDETITHHVVDRPIVDKKYISRYYIQPQWIFDCVNARLLLPLAGYLPGDVLPPHLSPFASEEDGAYIPPERQRVIALQRGEDPGNWYWSGKASGKMEMCCVGSTGNSVTDLSTKYSVPYCQKVSPCQRMKVDKSLIQKCVHVFTGINNTNEDLSEKEEDSEEDENDDEGEEEEVSPKKKRNAPTGPRALIRPGKTDKESQPDPDKVAAEEKKLAVMMIPKKRRRLYSKMTYRIKRRKREAELLAQKRKLIDEEIRKEKRRAKKSKS